MHQNQQMLHDKRLQIHQKQQYTPKPADTSDKKEYAQDKAKHQRQKAADTSDKNRYIKKSTSDEPPKPEPPR